MCLTFFEKFARNNTACPCVLAQFFKNVKHYLLNYGRIFAFKFQRLSSRFLCVRVVRCLYAVLLCGLAPLPLLAEWETQDRNTLNAIQVAVQSIDSSSRWSAVTSISTDVANIEDYLRDIDSSSSTAKNYLAYVLGNFGYGQGSSQTGSFAQDFDLVIDKLTAILTALESQGGTGGSGSGTEITQDWVKDTTFQDYSDNFQTYYDWMRSSLGFEGGSSGSLKDYLTPYYSLFSDTRYEVSLDVKILDNNRGANTVPYPNNTYKWADTEQVITEKFMVKNPYEFIVSGINRGLFNLDYDLMLNLKKQSWNDWQAHTNLVATIVTQADRFFTQPTSDPSPTPSFNPSTGQMVTPSTGTGSADETITVSPSFTNDFAQIEQDTNTVTNNFAFVKEQEIRKRYFVEGILDVGEYRDYATLGSGFTDVINIAGMTIDLNSQFVNYRKIISSETLQNVRTVVGYLWHFFAIVASFFVVIKISGMSLSSGGDE